MKMVKFQLNEPISSFAPATRAKQVTWSTVLLRPVRSFFASQIEMMYFPPQKNNKSKKLPKSPSKCQVLHFRLWVRARDKRLLGGAWLGPHWLSGHRPRAQRSPILWLSPLKSWRCIFYVMQIMSNWRRPNMHSQALLWRSSRVRFPARAHCITRYHDTQNNNNNNYKYKFLYHIMKSTSLAQFLDTWAASRDYLQL